MIDAVVRHGFGMVLCQSREFGISITKVAILNQEKILPKTGFEKFAIAINVKLFFILRMLMKKELKYRLKNFAACIYTKEPTCDYSL